MSSSDGNDPTFIATDYIIDEICDAFDEAWQKGEQPVLKEFLNRANDAARPQLFRELLLLDLEYRTKHGAAPNLDDYQQQFPGFAQILQEILHRQDSSTFIHRDPVQPQVAGTPANFNLSPLLPLRFGEYELLDELGRGGMGVVYRARDLNLNRIVALKMVLAGGFASEEVVKRFHGETEAVGSLDHPGIVPIYERGQCEGHHFFVMSYVAGKNLAQECRDGPMEPRKAAELVKTIAQAVHYAHQQGVIHRDLKPANILLAETGQPRITDFGLAKRIQLDEGLTATGQLLGTPSYMAPEQATACSDTGPTVDVYGLGAILYFLVTGRPPFQAADVFETLKQIKEQDAVSPRSLNAAIDQDLETICLKCLKKESGKRYASAQELVEDLGRHISGQTIHARKTGRAEKLWRWAKRNPHLAWVSAVLILILLAAGLAGPYLAVTYRNLAFQEKESAEKARLARQKAREEAKRANIEAATAREVSGFLAGLFEDTDPFAVSGRTFGVLPKANPTAVEILDRGVKKLMEKGSLKDQPLARAALLDKIGAAYLNLGDAKKAEPLLRQALQLRQKHLIPIHLDIAASLQSLAYFHFVRGNSPQAEFLLHKASGIRQKLLGEDHPVTAETAFQLGIVYMRAYRNKKAEPLLRKALAIRTKHFGKDSHEVAVTLVCLAQMYFNSGRKTKAVEYAMRFAKIADKISGKNVSAIFSEILQAQMWDTLGQVGLAEKAYRKSLAMADEIFGEDHYLVGWMKRNYCYFLTKQKRLGEAEITLRQVESIFRKQFGDESLEMSGVLLQLARCIRDQANVAGKTGMRGKRDRLWNASVKIMRQVVAIDRRHPTRHIGDFSTHLIVLGHLLAHKSPPELKQAEAMLREALVMRRELYGAAHEKSTSPLLMLTGVLLGQRKHGETVQLFRDHLSPATKIDWPTGSHLTLVAVAKILVQKDEPKLAVRVLQEAVSAGYKNTAHLKSHPEFRSLHVRDDFKELITSISK